MPAMDSPCTIWIQNVRTNNRAEVRNVVYNVRKRNAAAVTEQLRGCESCEKRNFEWTWRADDWWYRWWFILYSFFLFCSEAWSSVIETHASQSVIWAYYRRRILHNLFSLFSVSRRCLRHFHRLWFMHVILKRPPLIDWTNEHSCHCTVICMRAVTAYSKLTSAHKSSAAHAKHPIISLESVFTLNLTDQNILCTRKI